MNHATVSYKAKAFEPRNLALFFLLSLGFPFLVVLLTYFGLLHSPKGLSDPVLIPWLLLNIPIFLGPSTAAFVVVGVTEGKAGIKELWRRFWNRNVSLKWLAAAVLILPILRLIAAILTRIISGTPYPILVEGNISEILFVPILIGLFSGIHEEFGWRGYALPRFQAKWNALVSCIILGVITALWHLPGFITPGEPLFGRNFWEWLPWHMLIQIVGFGWIFNNTGGNILAVILFHVTTSLGLFKVDYTYYWVLLIAAILIVIIFGARDLVRNKAPVEKSREE